MNSLRRVILTTFLLVAVSIAAISQDAKPKQKEKAETKVAPVGKQAKSEKPARDSSLIRLTRPNDLFNEEDEDEDQDEDEEMEMEFDEDMEALAPG